LFGKHTERKEKREKREERREKRKKERSNLSLSLSPFFLFFSSPVPRRGACGATKVLSFLN